MKSLKYKQFYFWENLIIKNENLTEGYFRGMPLSRQSVFVNTVIVNCKTSILYDWWICFPDSSAALGFIQNVFLTSAYNSYLSPEEDYVAIITGTPEELLDVLEEETSSANKEDIPDMRKFVEDIEKLWQQDDEKLYDAFKEYSNEFNKRWGNVSNSFFYFNIFRSAEEVGQYVIEGYEGENILDYFTEETGLTKEQWLDIYNNVYENDFMKKKFMEILNNKICDLL